MPPRFNVTGILPAFADEEFFRGFVKKVHGKGSLVCTGEDDENGIFFVMSGRLRVFMVGEEREISMFYLKAGDMFSMHSGCLVEACEPTELRVTDIKTFQQKAKTHPQIAWELIAILGIALSSCMRTIEDLMFHNIKQRIARFFIDHAKAGEAAAHGGDTLVTFTVEEIANLVGSSRQRTSTAINILIKEGHISRHKRGSYVISDMDRLKSVADGLAE